ncbi:hypothetical protein O181_028261 [Austropuccinia psidii MF-1]|uniref:Uncharacterized protein n=1 Tax=Austropuccinia psidii MF-1 TaxID=1389203 RepID=A0A9Q3H276_9BASI|nr:hypothetical protein [Austropuccinia psidii MF-1]
MGNTALAIIQEEYCFETHAKILLAFSAEVSLLQSIVKLDEIPFERTENLAKHKKQTAKLLCTPRIILVMIGKVCRASTPFWFHIAMVKLSLTKFFERFGLGRKMDQDIQYCTMAKTRILNTKHTHLRAGSKVRLGGASPSNNMLNDKKHFISFGPKEEEVTLSDGSSIKSAGFGPIQIELPHLYLKIKNLLFIHQLSINSLQMNPFIDTNYSVTLGHIFGNWLSSNIL